MKTGRAPSRGEDRSSRPAVRFTRSSTDAVVAGIASGIGARWGVDPLVVRLGFIVLTFAGAVGIFAYLAAWAVALDPEEDEQTRDPTTRQTVSFGCIVLGVVFLLREAGLWFGDAIGIPLLLAAVGTGVIYFRSDEDARPRWIRGGAARELPVGRPSLPRILVGGSLVVGGMVVFLGVREDLAAAGTVVVAVGVTAAGLALAFGPWMWRLANQVAEERRERIRSQERADVAAHLHDSVLQTLALIQRSASSPRKMVSLARRQERELRAWLYGRPSPQDEASLAGAMEAMTTDVEGAHETPVEVVVVGDAQMDRPLRALVNACREAVTNAALHSGADEVSVYVECEPEHVTAFVRDRGRGFDPDTVPADRRGIADSIRGRVERHAGTVQITSAPGEGCEVQMQMPRATP